jgi:cyclophilin family peptidyl-prolyl cis-trans isomerase
LAPSDAPRPLAPDAGSTSSPTSCGPPADAGALAPELGHERDKDVRVTFTTDAGSLAIVFEPALAPLSVTRFVALAKAGFYDGIVVHRVVPGFVAQFGDPDGDGYGGAGALLRCETSPVPFGPLDVGVALAGRDTGSSQLFVTLGAYPHLDGEYARVGRAEGDWWALAEGDAIRGVKVED